MTNDFQVYANGPVNWRLPFQEIDEDLRNLAWWLESELWIGRTGWESDTVMAMSSEPTMPTDERMAWLRGEEGAQHKRRRVQATDDGSVTVRSSTSPNPNVQMTTSVELNTPGSSEMAVQAYLQYQVPSTQRSEVAP